MDRIKTVLLIGSAPDAVRARDFDASEFSAIVAINNAWRVRDDWTHLVFPDDFPRDALPRRDGNRTFVTSKQYVPANNAFGGVVFAGGTMALTAGYWALHALKPDRLAFIGCDMVYSDAKKTHFYGNGEPDPLRDDPTLQSLEAKANRLMWMAAKNGCLCLNLSQLPKSRLTFPRADESDRTGGSDRLNAVLNLADNDAVSAALALEGQLGVQAPGGDYWNLATPLDAARLAEIDESWLAAFAQKTA